MAASYAVQDAQFLAEIGFSEFTTKLVADIFDTLVSSCMTQTEMYLELIKEVSKTLTDFINSTKDDISGDLILQFLVAAAPDKASQQGTIIRKDNTQNPSSEQAAALNSKLAIEGYKQEVVTNDFSIADQYDTILKAVANRIAADKYTMLKEMVKLGILRVIVNSGEIETKINFKTYASNFYNANATTYNRSDFEFNAAARTGGFLSRWVKASASTRYSTLAVSTQEMSTGGNTSTDIQISGRVKIVFSTSAMNLAQ